MNKRQEKTKELLTQFRKTPKAHSLVISEILQQLMGQFGGPEKFAAAFFTEFQAANAGGLVRARMLADVFRLFTVHTTMLRGTATTVEGLTDEELTAAAKELLDGTDSD